MLPGANWSSSPLEMARTPPDRVVRWPLLKPRGRRGTGGAGGGRGTKGATATGAGAMGAGATGAGATWYARGAIGMGPVQAEAVAEGVVLLAAGNAALLPKAETALERAGPRRPSLLIRSHTEGPAARSLKASCLVSTWVIPRPPGTCIWMGPALPRAST